MVPCLPIMSTDSVTIVAPLQTDICLPLITHFQLFNNYTNSSTKFNEKYNIIYLISGSAYPY